MDSLRALSSLAKVLLLAGALMFVFGVIRLVTPYSAAAKAGGYTQNCGSALAPKSTVTTINCDHGGNLSLDLSLLVGGLVLSVGSAALWGAQSAGSTGESHGADRGGAYG